MRATIRGRILDVTPSGNSEYREVIIKQLGENGVVEAYQKVADAPEPVRGELLAEVTIWTTKDGRLRTRLDSVEQEPAALNGKPSLVGAGS